MKTIIFIILLVFSFAAGAQSCDETYDRVVVCHNGRKLIISTSALSVHLDDGDLFITCDTEGHRSGEDCTTLSLPKIDMKKPFPIGLEYQVVDLTGRILKKGITTWATRKDISTIYGVLILSIEGFEVLKIINK